jgi:methionyl-tRNA formyltransferase
MVGIGLIGEYVGRTYQVVRARQRYHVREVLERQDDTKRTDVHRESQLPGPHPPSPGYRMNPKPRILFFGYSEVGYECLVPAARAGDNVVALFTHEDNPNEKIWFKTPAVAAREKGVPIFTPEKVATPEWIEKIAALRPDLILSAYYRNMISTKILALARLGAFNLHGSLLPKYRGRAPINWAVLHGEPRIGMTLHRMVKAPDAGAIVDQEGVDIGPRDTAEQAFRKVLPCARRCSRGRSTPSSPARGGDAAGRVAGHLLRRAQARGRPDRLDQTHRQIFNLDPRRHRPLSRAPSPTSGPRASWSGGPSPIQPPAAVPPRPPGRGPLAFAPHGVATGDGALRGVRSARAARPRPALPAAGPPQNC